MHDNSYDFACFNMGHFNKAIAILAAILNSKMDPRFELYQNTPYITTDA